MPTTPGSFIPRFAFWNPSTWAIPELYWDTFSQEQRVHAICKQLGKVIAYADMLGVNVDDIASRLKAIEDGELDEYIVQKIEEWFEENEPAIVAAIEQLQQDVSDIEDILPKSSFTSSNTVKKYVDDNVSDLGDKLPASEFTSTNTVKKYVDDEIVEAKQRKCILIGDSYLRNYSGDGYTNPGWGDYFIAETGFTEVARYKSGGAGWIALGNSDTESGLNFGGMLQKAYNTLSDSVCEDVDYIIVQGLINDLAAGQTVETIRNYMRTFCDNARSWFPNATVCITLAMCSDSYMTNIKVPALVADIGKLMRDGAKVSWFSPIWFTNLVSSYGRGDDTHPNDSGYRYLARMMAENVTGNEPYLAQSWNSSAIRSIVADQIPGYTDWASIAGRIYAANNMVNLFLEITITNASNLPAEKGQRVQLPFRWDSTSTQYISPSYVTHAGKYIVRPTSVALQNGWVTFEMYPNATDPSTGSAITYSNNDTIRYECTFPIWG